LIRRLTNDERDRYDHVPPALSSRVRIVSLGLLLPGVDGLTLGPIIVVRHDRDRSGRRDLLAHELVHVAQYHQHGWTRFLRSYLGGYLRARWSGMSHRDAYLNLPAEIEARKETDRWRSTRLSDEGHRPQLGAEEPPTAEP